ncbi:MAG: hypothetical protein QXY45_01425 [Candidatus Aenigmatarchaeota archaeon]
MVLDEKTKIGIITLAIIIITIFVFTFKDKVRVVDILYFREDSCIVVNKTDKIIEEIKKDFNGYINLRIIDRDKTTPDEEKLIKKYNVIGVPVIIINGKEYTKEFTKDNLEREICKKLLRKPKVC